MATLVIRLINAIITAANLSRIQLEDIGTTSKLMDMSLDKARKNTTAQVLRGKNHPHMNLYRPFG
ncbi:hypothetical protein B0H19DRAFT_1178491 [Mycena capillaripes]|nr:hypothetical protein B0H19DRAFT_1178491 [Mycena capillaripes]